MHSKKRLSGSVSFHLTAGSLHAPPHHLASQPAGAKRILPGPTSQQFPSSSCATPARPTRPSAPQPSSIHVGLSPQTAPPNPINILRSHPTAPRSLPSSTVPPSQAPAPTTASSFSAQSSAAVPLSQQPHPSSMPARGLAAGQPAKAPAPARDAPAAKAPSASTSALSGGSNATSGAAAQPQVSAWCPRHVAVLNCLHSGLLAVIQRGASRSGHTFLSKHAVPAIFCQSAMCIASGAGVQGSFLVSTQHGCCQLSICLACIHY